MNSNRIFSKCASVKSFRKIVMILVIGIAGSYGAMAQQSMLITSKSVCPGAQTVFSTAISNYCTTCSYSYTGPGISNTIGTLSSLPGGMGHFTTSPIQLSAGTYTVKSGTTSIGTFTISNYSIGSISTSRSPNDLSVCAGTAVTMTASGGTNNNYEWRLASASPSSTPLYVGKDYTVTAVAGQTINYIVTGNVSCGATSSANNSVTGKFPVTSASITGGVSSRCTGAGSTDFNYDATGSTSASWSITSGAGSIDGNGIVTWNSSYAGVATIYLTAYGNCGSSASASTTVTVQNPPTPVSTNKTITTCESRTISATPAGHNRLWYNTSWTPISTPNWSGLGVGTHTYYSRNQNVSSLCVSTGYGTTTFTINNPTHYISQSVTNCVSNSQTNKQLVVQAPDPNCSYEVRNTVGGFVSHFTDTGQGYLTYTFSPSPSPGSVSYHVYSNGVYLDAYTYTTVADDPASTAISVAGNLGTDPNGGSPIFKACDPSDITLSPNVIGISYTNWSWTEDGVTIPGGALASIQPTVGDHIYELVLVGTNLQNCYAGAISNPSVRVQVNPPIANLASQTPTFNECQTGRSVAIGGGLPTGYGVQWFDDLGNSLPGMFNNTPDFDALPPGNHSFKVKAISGDPIYRCYSPSFANVDITVLAENVTISAPSLGTSINTGSANVIAKTEANIYNGIAVSYSLSRNGIEVPIADPSNWAVPAGQEWGDNYRIKALTNCAHTFWSDEFSIADFQRSTLIAPLSGEFITAPTTEIKWLNTPGDTYKLYLTSVVSGVSQEIDMSAAPPVTNGVYNTYQLTTPSNVLGLYEVKVQDTMGNNVYTADVEFIAPVQVTFPNLAISLEIGTSRYITWSGGSVDVGTEFIVELFKGGVYLDQLALVTGERTYNWNIDESLIAGTDYSINVRQDISSPGAAALWSEDESDENFSLINCSVGPANVSTDRNYVKTYTARGPEEACLNKINDKYRVTETIQYLDGLGRLEQEVLRNGTPDVGGVSYDVISATSYDPFGRLDKEMLPYKSAGNTGQYDASAATSQSTYYNQLFPGQGNYAFSQKSYEASPLNRILAAGAPGDVWQVGNGHTVDNSFGSNTLLDDIKQLTVDVSGNVVVGTYQTGQLMTDTVKDENSGVKRGQTVTFTNKSGEVVMKEVKLNSNSFAQTYYVHDDFGNLTYVIQPEGTRLMNAGGTYDWTSVNDDTFRQQWIFCYQYDLEQRMTAKRIPGSDWVYMIYDERDRLVLTQSGNERKTEVLTGNLSIDEYAGKSYVTDTHEITLTTGFSFKASATSSFTAKADSIVGQDQWLVTKYDHLNRPVMTGMISPNIDMTTLKNGVAGETIFHEDYTGAGPLQGYTSNTYPSLPADDLLTVTYYDDYSFTNEPIPAGARSEVIGLVTGTKTKVLGTDTWLTSITYYNERYRPIKTITDNHVGGKEVVDLTYLSEVSPLVIASTNSHTGIESVTMVKNYTYDHLDRVLTTTQSINGETAVTLHSNSYNEVGELKEKNIGNGVQSVDYGYNIRGWLETINGGANLFDDPTDKFGFKLLYYDANNLAAGWNQFNGNIGYNAWRTLKEPSSGAQSKRFYYDNASRFTSSLYTNVDITKTDHFREYGITYDDNGNIKTLKRNHESTTAVDNLSYAYVNGNQLSAVTDASLDSALFTDGNIGSTDYFYDANGNMTVDKNKGIQQINYNYLNLPELVTFDDGNVVKYTYNSAGIKLKRENITGANTSTTEYVGGMHFTDGSLNFIPHSEGRAVKNGTSFDYEYNLTDHLGNVRVSVDASGNVVQSQDYYAFGLTFNEGSTPSNPNPYKFNGMEEQALSKWSDFGARMYDPTVARWFNIDPLTEAMRRHSPYNYAYDNPIRYIDPDGMMPEDKVRTHTVTTTSNGSKSSVDHYEDGSTSEAYEGGPRDIPNTSGGSSASGGSGMTGFGAGFNNFEMAVNNQSNGGCPNCGMADYLRESPILGYGPGAMINPFYKAEAIYSDVGAILAGAEIDAGKFFILSGPDKGKFINYSEIAGGAAPEMGVGSELGRIDFTGDVSKFNPAYLEGYRHKVWVGLSAEVIGGGVGVTWSYVRGAGYIIGTSIQIGTGVSFPISGGYNQGTVKLKKKGG